MDGGPTQSRRSRVDASCGCDESCRQYPRAGVCGLPVSEVELVECVDASCYQKSHPEEEKARAWESVRVLVKEGFVCVC